MSYTCPDCKDGILVAKIRDIPIGDDETAEIVDGRVRVTAVRCNNGCSPESEEEEEEERPTREKRMPPKAWVDPPGQKRCTRSDLCSKAYAHTGACNKMRAEANAL
jgi:hypothetical protein